MARRHREQDRCKQTVQVGHAVGQGMAGIGTIVAKPGDMKQPEDIVTTQAGVKGTSKNRSFPGA